MKKFVPKVAALVLGSTLLIGGVQQSSAATSTATYTASFSGLKTDINTSLVIPKFDIALGTLQSVTITLGVNVTTTITLTNNASSDSSGSVKTEVLYYLNTPSASLLGVNDGDPIPGNPNGEYAATVDILTANQTYTLTAGSGATVLDTKNKSGSNAETYTTQLILGEFSGSGTISLSLGTFTQTVQSNSGGNTSADQATYTSGTATVTYTYIPATNVPEPSTWVMMLGGLGVLTFGQRLRKRLN